MLSAMSGNNAPSEASMRQTIGSSRPLDTWRRIAFGYRLEGVAAMTADPETAAAEILPEWMLAQLSVLSGWSLIEYDRFLQRVREWKQDGKNG